MWSSMAKLTILCFWDKATITKYGLWTTAGKKFEVSSLCSLPRSPVLKFSSECNETLLRTLHVEVHILAVYTKYVALPTKSMSSMATKMLERERYSGTFIIQTPLGPYQIVLTIEVSLVWRLCKPPPSISRAHLHHWNYSDNKRRPKGGQVESDISVFGILVW